VYSFWAVAVILEGGEIVRGRGGNSWKVCACACVCVRVYVGRRGRGVIGRNALRRNEIPALTSSSLFSVSCASSGLFFIDCSSSGGCRSTRTPLRSSRHFQQTIVEQKQFPYCIYFFTSAQNFFIPYLLATYQSYRLLCPINKCITAVSTSQILTTKKKFMAHMIFSLHLNIN
jgi:hypothetical protein